MPGADPRANPRSNPGANPGAVPGANPGAAPGARQVYCGFSYSSSPTLDAPFAATPTTALLTSAGIGTGRLPKARPRVLGFGFWV